ncbi:hypothetical protein AMQ83_16670 [Paenibacillus riograndensis]|nr:hypothetical protein AMQ83_16670 [Paenibacillus riograndensis]
MTLSYRVQEISDETELGDANGYYETWRHRPWGRNKAYFNWDGTLKSSILDIAGNSITKLALEIRSRTLTSFAGICFELEDVDYDEEWDEMIAPISAISVFT